MRKVLISAIIGNALEWYDYALYAHFLSIITKLFFPSENEFVSTIAAFGVLAAGFFMRPLGAIIFGIIGDRYGRKLSLALSILMMAIPTALIGLMPTYEQIGILAPIFLTIIRLVQGLSLGGEFSGSISYVTEHAPKNKQAFAGSTTMFSMCIGILAGLATAGLTSYLVPMPEFEVWGWRIPFILGLIVGLVGLYIRSSLEESPEYENAKSNGELVENPTRLVFTEHSNSLIKAIVIYLTVTIPFYTFVFFLNTYSVNYLNIEFKDAITINTIAMVVMTALLPYAGLLADKYGKKKIVLRACIAFIFLIYPIFNMINEGGMLGLLMGQTLLAILIAFYMGPVPAILVELFPTNVRFSGVAISYNISAAFFGGTVPVVFTSLIKYLETPKIMPAYIMFFALCSLLSLLKFKENFTIDMQDLKDLDVLNNLDDIDNNKITGLEEASRGNN